MASSPKAFLQRFSFDSTAFKPSLGAFGQDWVGLYAFVARIELAAPDAWHFSRYRPSAVRSELPAAASFDKHRWPRLDLNAGSGAGS